MCLQSYDLQLIINTSLQGALKRGIAKSESGMAEGLFLAPFVALFEMWENEVEPKSSESWIAAVHLWEVTTSQQRETH